MDARRDFLRKVMMASAGVAATPLMLAARTSDNEKGAMQADLQPLAKRILKNWVWINPDPKKTASEMERTYSAYARAGITGVFFEQDSEKHDRAAKKQGLETHHWMWTLNGG